MAVKTADKQLKCQADLQCPSLGQGLPRYSVLQLPVSAQTVNLRAIGPYAPVTAAPVFTVKENCGKNNQTSNDLCPSHLYSENDEVDISVTQVSLTFLLEIYQWWQWLSHLLKQPFSCHKVFND